MSDELDEQNYRYNIDRVSCLSGKSVEDIERTINEMEVQRKSMSRYGIVAWLLSMYSPTAIEFTEVLSLSGRKFPHKTINGVSEIGRLRKKGKEKKKK